MTDEKLTDIEPFIDYEKSVAKQKLVYKITIWIIWDSVISYFIMLLFIFLGLLPLVALFTGSHVPLLLSCFCLIYLAWMLANILLRNAFVKIIGTDDDNNQSVIKETLNSFYNDDLDFQIADKKMLRSMVPTGSVSWGRVITVVFDKNIILLNITTLGKGNAVSFLHGYSNYVKARRFLKYYNSSPAPSRPWKSGL